jgi:hypothetical protein
VGVVLGELAHAQQAVEHAGLFVAMHHAKFEVALGQIAVAAHPRLVDEHVGQAVHGLDAVGLPVDLGEIHVFAVVVIVAGPFPELPLEDLGAAYELIAAAQMFLALEVLENGAHKLALGMPNGHAGPGLFGKTEQIELGTELAMIALLGFFQMMQIGLEVGF